MTNSVSPSVDKNIHALGFWKGITVIVQTTSCVDLVSFQ